MMTRHFSRYCTACGKQTMHVRTSGDQIMVTAVFLIITIATCGCGFPFALLVASWMNPAPRCTVCGKEN
jgi:hypothetical protein